MDRMSSWRSAAPRRFPSRSSRGPTRSGVSGPCRCRGDRTRGDVVLAMAVAAARDAPRFPPVAVDELPVLRYEISGVGEAALLDPADPGRIVIGRDGLWVRRGQASGVLLPQVAAEQRWTASQFLAAACRKASLPSAGWREPGTRVYTFQADIFGE